MAKIDYYNIEEQIKSIILAAVPGVTVEIERQFIFSPDKGNVVYIYLDSRTPTAGQRIAAGTRTDYQLTFSVWCFAWSLESVAKASEFRDDLLGAVEITLIANRTLNDTVKFLYLDGGQFLTEEDNSFFSGGEIRVVAEVHMTTA